MADKLLVICLLTILVHTVETLSYAVRFAGVKTGKIAVALSLTGIIVLISRTANMLQGPSVGKMIDYAKYHPEFELERYLRTILGASSVGTLIAMILFPSVVYLSCRMVSHLEESGSIPKLMFSVSIDKLKHARRYLRKPTLHMLRSLRLYDVPKRLLILNCLATAIFSIGVLSTLYASHMSSYGVAASQASGLVNGIATILLTILVDPQMAMLTDRALREEKARNRLGKVFGLLMISRFVGTLLGQLLFIPASMWVNWIIKFF